MANGTVYLYSIIQIMHVYTKERLMRQISLKNLKLKQKRIPAIERIRRGHIGASETDV